MKQKYDIVISDRNVKKILIKNNIVIRTATSLKFNDKIDDAIIINLYVEQRKSIYDIVSILKIKYNLKFSASGIRHRLKEKNIKLRNNNEANIIKEVDDNLLKELYLNKKKSTCEISEILKKDYNINFSVASVKNRLVKIGVTIRNGIESHNINSLYSNLDIEKLIKLYVEDKCSLKTLSRINNCSVESIRQILIKKNIDRFKNTSYIEHNIQFLLEKNNIDNIKNSRSIIAPLELDFYLPEHKIAIECNGLYFHSFEFGNKHKKYHYNKYLQCKEQGITLLQFWEDDIRDKFNIIESMILSRLNKSENKLDARKCQIKNLSFAEIRDFCNENHIQGQPANNNKGIGLFYNEKLISLLSYVEHNNLVITRFCSLLNYNVRGGFGKLLNHLKSFNKIIITYSSNDISNGNLYLANGFECINETIDMYYCNNIFIFNRQQFMKHKLKNKLKIFDENLTEKENMKMNGYNIIYKSGIKTWIFNK